MAGWNFNTPVSSATSALLYSYYAYLRNLSQASQDNTDASRSEEWHRGSLSIWHSDIGIPNNTEKLSGIVKIWSSGFHVALESSKDVRPLFEMRWRPRSFCRVSTVNSDILSSCDMNDEHALSLCWEIWPSFESGHLGVYLPWSIKHRVPLTYIFLR